MKTIPQPSPATPPNVGRSTSNVPCSFFDRLALPGLLLILLAGCAVGPDYKRPAADAPATYRRAVSDTNASSGEKSFADLGWWETFQDPQLLAYLSEALTNSWDVKI